MRSLVSGFGYDFHEGPADYCEATGELFVTISNITNSDEIQKMIPVENIRLRLVIKKQIDGKWQTVEELPFNNKKFNFAQPAISTSGDTLIFSSDLNSKSYGKSDLFMSIRKEGKWSTPVNLGDLINTTGNELFPTFIPGGLLSFASDGRTTNYGGLDIFYTRFPELDKVEILNGNINTPFDDFGLIINKNGSFGYFASNRDSKMNDDIFRLNIRKLYTIFNGRVIDFETNLPIPNASVFLNNCTGEIINKFITDSTGNFSFDIMNKDCPKIEILKDGYENETMNISGRDYYEFKLIQKQIYEIFVLDGNNQSPVDGATISCNEEVIFKTNSQGIASFSPPYPRDCEMSINKDGYLLQTFLPNFNHNISNTRDTVWINKKELNNSYLLGNINSVSGELKILKEATPILDRLKNILNTNPDIIVELGWHTDSRGNDSDNLRLSQKRADFAVTYLTNNGIDKNRIVGKGYGESKLLNKCKNGVKCTEEEHLLNRRIEFKIIGFLKL